MSYANSKGLIANPCAVPKSTNMLAHRGPKLDIWHQVVTHRSSVGPCSAIAGNPEAETGGALADDLFVHSRHPESKRSTAATQLPAAETLHATKKQDDRAVGCVVGVACGEGWHQTYQRAHASKVRTVLVWVLYDDQIKVRG